MTRLSIPSGRRLNIIGIPLVLPTGFKLTIDADIVAHSAAGTFILPTTGSGYDADIDWGDGNVETITGTPGNVTHVYAVSGVYDITVTEKGVGGFPQIYCNNAGLDEDKITEIKHWGDNRWLSFVSAFEDCNNLTTVSATDAPNLSNVTSLNEMFREARMTTMSLEGWDTSTITNMGGMYYSCVNLNLLDVSNLDVSAVTGMSYMFNTCSVLTSLDVTNWDVSKVTTFLSMFRSCLLLETFDISNWVTTSLTRTDNMFRRSGKFAFLDFTGWDFSNVTNTNYMFFNYGTSTDIDMTGIDTSSLETCVGMFGECDNMDIDISAWNITSLTDATGMMELSSFSTTNYDKMLIAWEAQAYLPNVAFHAGTAKYSTGAAATARANMIANGWTFTDGGPV